MRTWILLIVLAIIAAGATAHEGATGIAAERMSLMESMSKETKAIAAILKRRGPPTEILPRAERLRELSRHIEHLFPPGSGTGVTAASPAIWQQWSEFEGLARTLGARADTLAAAAAGAAAGKVADRFADVSDVCAKCHKAFRVRRLQ